MIPSRLYLSDHLLNDVVGHHLGYNLALADAARGMGVPVELVTHRQFDSDLASGFEVIPLFHTDHRFAPPSLISQSQRMLSWLASWSACRFAWDLKGLPPMRSSDAVFAQMLAPRHFLEWLKWFRRQSTPPVLFLHLGYSPEKFSSPEIALTIASLGRKLQDRVFLVTDSEKLAPAFESILDESVHYLPHIISYDFPCPVSREGSQPLVIFVPGNARREKGFVEVCQAVKLLGDDGNNYALSFVIQCHDPDAICGEILQSGICKEEGGDRIKGIEWIESPLSDDEYIRLLAQADVILMPYHLDCYARRTSGIFCEARVLGKPVITTRGSWAGDRVEREGGGWLVNEKDISSLARTLNAVPTEFVAKRTDAQRLADQSKNEFHREAFMRKLLELFAGVPNENI